MHWTEYAAKKTHLLEQYVSGKHPDDDLDFHPLDAEDVCDVNDPTDFELLDMVPWKQIPINWQLDFELNEINELRADEFADCVPDASICSDIELEKLDVTGTNATAAHDHVVNEEKSNLCDVVVGKPLPSRFIKSPRPCYAPKLSNLSLPMKHKSPLFPKSPTLAKSRAVPKCQSGMRNFQKPQRLPPRGLLSASPTSADPIFRGLAGLT